MAENPTNERRDDVDIDISDATLAEERREADAAHAADLRHPEAAGATTRKARAKRSVRRAEEEMNEIGARTRGEGRV